MATSNNQYLNYCVPFRYSDTKKVFSTMPENLYLNADTYRSGKNITICQGPDAATQCPGLNRPENIEGEGKEVKESGRRGWVGLRVWRGGKRGGDREMEEVVVDVLGKLELKRESVR